MSDEFELSRRKVLGAAGGIGLASAGAGLGTTAYLSDTESFQGNSMTAGELDLKVDWEEHYWDDFDAGVAVEQVESPDDVGDDQVALPDRENPMIAVNSEDLDTFMNATAIEAFPDSDDNGVQDPLEGYNACMDFADMPEGLDPSGLRSENDDTTSDGDGWAPLVNLHDVKPGDFGELTLSFHLCDNPGYVWLQGEQVNAAENGHTEPESVVDSDDDVELLDEIRTLLWYDEDGDNVYEPGVQGEEVDLVIVFDQSESMNANSGSDDNNPGKLDAAVSGAKSLVDTIGGSAQQGLVMFSSPDMTGVVRGLGSSVGDIKGDFDALDGPDDTSSPVNDNNDDLSNSEGNGAQVDSDGDGRDDDNLLYQTDMEGGIRAGTDELLNGSSARSGARKIMVVLGDGKPFLSDGQSNSEVIAAATDAKDGDIEIFSIAYGGGADESLMESIASDPADTYSFSGGEADIGSIFGQIGQIVGGEEAFFRGSLRDLLGAVSSSNGIPLDGNRDTPFEELGDDPTSEDREEFINSTNNFIGFAWWVPRSVGNSIQGDSVGFDLGFYTEQSRHNDGSGPT